MAMGDETVFKLDDAVQVNGAGIYGRVRGIWIDHGGAQFSVQYTDLHGRIQRDWFHAAELTAA